MVGSPGRGHRTGVGTPVGTEGDPSPGESAETREDKVIPEVREAQAAEIQFISPFLRNQGKTQEA